MESENKLNPNYCLTPICVARGLTYFFIYLYISFSHFHFLDRSKRKRRNTLVMPLYHIFVCVWTLTGLAAHVSLTLMDKWHVTVLKAT